MYSFKQLQKHKVLDKKRCVELVPFWGTQGNGVSISVPGRYNGTFFSAQENSV